MPTLTSRRLFCHMLAVLLHSWSVVSLSADEHGERLTTPTTADAPASLPKRWYTNLDEAQRVANDLGRPIMIVFR